MTTSIKKPIFGFFGRKSSPATRQPRARRRRQFCVVEGLEERVLQAGPPTVFMVNNTSNNAALVGSLPFEIKKADANPNPAGSLIEFNDNVFKATTPRTITLASTLALTETTGPLVIDGPGASIVTISGNNAVQVFSVATGVTASLSGLTISEGSSTNANEGGGGIDNAGTLTVANSTIEHNSADYGGGIDNDGTLTVTDSTIEHNSAFEGGGIQNDGTLTVSNSTIELNTAAGGFGGGGIFNDGTLTVTGSIIESNSASVDGGGILNDAFGNVSGTLTVTNSTIENNTAVEAGGGIENAGTVNVFQSTIAGNSAVEGSGIDTEGGTLTVIGSTIANNLEALDGGGILIGQSTVLLVNSTIAHDSASRFGGGIAILSNHGSLLAVNCTIAYNTVSSAGAGGGLYVSPGVTTTLENTIVADNTMPSEFSLHPGLAPIPLQLANDIVLAAGANNVSGSYNLVGAAGTFGGTGGSGGLTNGVDGNQVGVQALLGPLASNGGPTQTIALLAGSPAIDAGNVALAHYDVTVAETLTFDGHTTTIFLTRQINLTTDQRGTGFPRTHNRTVDIGAFEVQPKIIIHPPGGPILG
ncbi:MAG: choice-of-anchor Q domain-containing protein [Isosphaeraceae bacterium]